jgi:hypothetical protein
MTHLEQIQVYNVVSEDDGFAGAYEWLELATNAPTVATITQRSGDPVLFGESEPLTDTFDVIVNYRNDFNWKIPQVVYNDRWGYLKVRGIKEDKRLRTIKLKCISVEDWAWQVVSV